MTTYVLADLPYDYSAWEPWCRAEIMKLHHDKHHRAYVDGANRALDALAALDVTEPKDANTILGLQQALVFNVSGHDLHSLFWDSLSPDDEGPDGALRAAIEESFGSVATMSALLEITGAGVRGSGWAALTWDPCGQRLHVSAIHDHQSDMFAMASPLAVIDVWEHAYYLQYRSERRARVEAAVSHIAWGSVEARFTTARQFATV